MTNRSYQIVSRKIFIIAVCLFVAIGLFFIADFFQKSSFQLSQKPLVAASIFPVYDLAREVAGNEVKVVLIVPPGSEPHMFEPPPSRIKELQRAEAVYTIGHGIDEWIRPIIANTNAEEVVLDTGIRLRQSQVIFTDRGAEEEGPVDPHFWLTMQNAKRMVQTINADLRSRFPARADQFQKNTDAYLEKLSIAEEKIQMILAPAKGRTLITLHDAWYYFVDAYGLTIAGTYLPTAGREPSALYLTALAKAVKASGARSLFHEPQFSTETLRPFANDYGLRLVILDDIGGKPPRDSFINLMMENAKAIADNP